MITIKKKFFFTNDKINVTISVLMMLIIDNYIILYMKIGINDIYT